MLCYEYQRIGETSQLAPLALQPIAMASGNRTDTNSIYRPCSAICNAVFCVSEMPRTYKGKSDRAKYALSDINSAIDGIAT